MMHPGFIVGIIVALSVIVSGIGGLVSARKRDRTCKWGKWAILVGVVALISAGINFKFFY